MNVIVDTRRCAFSDYVENDETSLDAMDAMLRLATQQCGVKCCQTAG